MSIGERILNEIVKQGMVSVAYPELDNQPVVFTWAANSEEQLTALIHNTLGIPLPPPESD